MRSSQVRSLLAFGSLAMCLLAGCGDEVTDPCRSSVPAGEIQGVVRTGGSPIGATVRATRVVDDSGDEGRFEAVVRLDNSYSLDVPAGRYVVGLRFETASVVYEYSASGLRFGDAPPDTLVVEDWNSPVVVNFDLASMHILLELPAELDGEYALVQLHRLGAPPPSEGRTYRRSVYRAIEGAGLDFVFSGVLPGSYRVEAVVGYTIYLCDCPPGGEHLWIPGVRDSADSPWFEVPVDRTVEVVGRIDWEPARIQGSIGGAWLELGLSTPPALALYDPDSNLVNGSREVDNDGSFDVAVYVPGPVKLLVSHAGIDQWIGGRSFEEAARFDLESGQTIAGIEFVQSGMRIGIDFPPNGGFLNDAWFRIYDAGSQSLEAATLVTYSTQPYVGIPNLRPGTYLLQIEPRFQGNQTWAPQWFDRASSAAEATPITIGHEGEIAAASMILEKGGSIAGVVREIPGVTVDYYLYLTRADEPEAYGRSWAWSGEFTFAFTGLPDGDWKVGALRRYPLIGYPEQPPEGTVWYPGTTDWRDAGIISIRGHEDVAGIEIVMPDGMARQHEPAGATLLLHETVR